jgi:hypothetical protein
MSVKRVRMPTGPAVNGDGRLSQAFHTYLAVLEDVSGRTSAEIEDLPASPTVEQIATAFNALLAAMKAAKQMQDD